MVLPGHDQAIPGLFRFGKARRPPGLDFSVFGSNLTSEPCIMLPIQTIPFRSNRTSRLPLGAPGFMTGMGYSVAWPVLGSSRPTYCDPKSEYQIIPRASICASCGIAIGRGRSYSVMITRVALPVGRGSVFKGYDHSEPPALRLIVLIYWPSAALAAVGAPMLP